MNDVVINKMQSIQRCVARAREEYEKDPATFDSDYTRQDAAVLNILRACEQAIDLANYVIRQHKMGVPTASADSFALLQQQGVITDELRRKMTTMVHFRNLLVHQYQQMNLEIVQTVIASGLGDLLQLSDTVWRWLNDRQQQD